jgi:hypothetical protein
MGYHSPAPYCARQNIDDGAGPSYIYPPCVPGRIVLGIFSITGCHIDAVALDISSDSTYKSKAMLARIKHDTPLPKSNPDYSQSLDLYMTISVLSLTMP